MPELPEVEVVRRGLQAHVAGKTITAVDVRDWKMPGLACALLYLVLSVPLARLARRFEMARDDAERDTNAKGGERP